jgi:hypothetical protein
MAEVRNLEKATAQREGASFTEDFWIFSITGAHADFYGALEEMKKRIPGPEREWDHVGKRWSIPVRHSAILGDIFENFAALREEIESQLELPF